jgi:hypothetical protein
VNLEYLCLSDLHLGAPTGLLTAVEPKGPDETMPGLPIRPVGSERSEVLVNLMKGLRSLVDPVHGTLPKLVLAGDILELGLATETVALETFEHFIHLGFVEYAPMFDREIFLIPGNHDHDLWELSRNDLYLEQVSAGGASQGLKRARETTSMRPSPYAGSRTPAKLLEAVIHRHPYCRDVRVTMFYPNLAVIGSDSRRCVVFSHGHYIESAYRAVTELKEIAFPLPDGASVTKPEIDQLEAENRAWINLVWSSSPGRELRRDIGWILALLSDPEAVRLWSRTIAEGWATRWPAGSGGPLPFPIAAAATLGLPRLLVKLAPLERFKELSATEPLSAAGWQGLSGYLRDFVFPEMEREAMRPGTTAFVFGHTHRPFARELTGFPTPLTVHNTGGWVVDSGQPDPGKGAAVAIVDDRLRVRSVKLIDQSFCETIGRPAVLPLAESSASPSDSFAQEVDQRLGDPVWQEFSEAAFDEVSKRRACIRESVKEAIEYFNEWG